MSGTALTQPGILIFWEDMEGLSMQRPVKNGDIELIERTPAAFAGPTVIGFFADIMNNLSETKSLEKNRKTDPIIPLIMILILFMLMVFPDPHGHHDHYWIFDNWDRSQGAMLSGRLLSLGLPLPPGQDLRTMVTAVGPVAAFRSTIRGGPNLYSRMDSEIISPSP